MGYKDEQVDSCHSYDSFLNCRIKLTCQKWFTDILSVIFIICQLFGLLIKEIKNVRKKITKKELVYNQIRNAIISGELSPGEILNEAEISLRFSSGKTPTREALLLLVHDRFLESLPRIGYQITKPTLQDVLELFYLRRLLEGEAMLLAFNNITNETIDHLVKNNNQINYCFDIGHAFAYGYDVSSTQNLVDLLDQTMGLDNIKLIHLSDTREKQGSKKDNHVLPGQGELGIETLLNFCRHPKIKNIPKILELPFAEKDLTMELLTLFNK